MQEPEPVFLTSSPGKVLLSGEYFVLWGATALAFPSLQRQYLTVCDTTDQAFHRWTTSVGSTEIFSCLIDKISLHAYEVAGSKASAEFIEKLLWAARSMNPAIFETSRHFHTELDFQPEWGLGSSSSLIVNISRFTHTDPWVLHQTISQGSGYDVACALHEKPLLFSHPENPRISFPVINYPFADSLYFLPLGFKKDSSRAIRETAHLRPSTAIIEEASQISYALTWARTLTEFSELLKSFMHLVKRGLGLNDDLPAPLNDFGGLIKPLGAWGGDLALVISDVEEDWLRNWFNSRGYARLIKWQDIIPTFQNTVLHE
ncbi:MAG: hypothetical protein ACP5O2_03230 [Bacteroidales bacterium]